MAQRSARREARSRAEADAGHRKRALLPLPAREPQRAFAISHGKRIARREARSRAEADAGHRKRALLPLPARKPQRAFSISQDKRFVQDARPAQGPKRMQGTARGRCFRFPHEKPNEHSPYRRTNESQDARPAQGPKRMQGTARGRCFRFPYERPNEHLPYPCDRQCSSAAVVHKR